MEVAMREGALKRIVMLSSSGLLVVMVIAISF